MLSSRSITLVLALAAAASRGALAAADPWTNTAYQQKQWQGAVAASDDGYLQGLCRAAYKPATVTVLSTATAYSSATRVSYATSWATVVTTSQRISTTRPIQIVSVPTTTTVVASTTTETTVFSTTLTVTGDAQRRQREKRAAQATGRTATHQQIDTVFTKMGQYNPIYRNDQCQLLIGKIRTRVISTTLPATKIVTSTRTATRTSVKISDGVTVIPTTTTVLSVSTVPAISTRRRTVTRVSTTTVAPQPTGTPGYQTCPGANVNYFLNSVDTVGFSLKCSYKHIASTNTYDCSYNTLTGDPTGPNSDPSCTTLDASVSIGGNGCWDYTSCPNVNDKDIDTMSSGARAYRSSNTPTGEWNYELFCAYLSGPTCKYDPESELLIEGSDECSDDLDPGFATGNCIFPGAVPVTPGSITFARLAGFNQPMGDMTWDDGVAYRRGIDENACRLACYNNSACGAAQWGHESGTSVCWLKPKFDKNALETVPNFAPSEGVSYKGYTCADLAPQLNAAQRSSCWDLPYTP